MNSVQHTPGRWVSHIVTVRLADGSKVITTSKGRTQQEAEARAIQFLPGAAIAKATGSAA